jgi:hypothetical protein
MSDRAHRTIDYAAALVEAEKRLVEYASPDPWLSVDAIKLVIFRLKLAKFKEVCDALEASELCEDSGVHP